MTTAEKAPLPKPILKMISTKGYRNLHRMLFRLSKGRIAGRINGMETILLTTTGRKSGMPRTVPLLFLEDGASMVIVASNSGGRTHPDWWFNIQSTPLVTVTTRRGDASMTARPATPEESTRMWPRLAATNVMYEYYPKVTEREIPLVYLDPISR